ncbi:MAG: aspartate/glutamate racemase family protein [Betaproteobacteria bacterium]|nr:aspartate/glutamate racemase family protein [Betaproteobacteria bacterium]
MKAEAKPALRVGLMVPINNTTMEPELLAWLPAGSTCRTLRIPRGKGTLTPKDLPAYVGQAMKMAKKFADDDIDLVVYGCTAAGFMLGPRRDAGIAAELAGITHKPVVTTASAMIVALRHLNARNIALVTPYLDLVNERLKSFLEESGIAVKILASFRAQSVDDLAAIEPAQIAALSRQVMRESCDALFIACSQLPTHEILPDLERELGRPAWSSIRATAWHAYRAALTAPVSGGNL